MTIDEAIAHEKIDSEPCSILCTHTTNRNDCIECRAYHKQLAEWLEELKDYQDKNKMVVRVDVENMDSIKDKIEELSKYAERQYNKAIDDLIAECENAKFAESDEISLSDVHTGVNSGLSMAIHFAEQLKAGGADETVL